MTRFQFKEFLKFFFYHILFFGISPLVAIPLIYIMEGAKVESMYNMQFLGCSMGVMMQWAVGLIITAGHVFGMRYMMAMRALIESEEEYQYIAPSDWVHLILIIVCRMLVVGVKYGYYSEEHLYLFRNYRLSDTLLGFHLLNNTLNNEDPTFKMQNIDDCLRTLELQPSSFTVSIFKDQQKYWIKNAEETINRLQSAERMLKYYTNKNWKEEQQKRNYILAR